jgi:hypothetical protein
MSIWVPGMGDPIPKSPRQELEESWLENHKHGDPAVRTYYEAVRDELQRMGTMAVINPSLGVVYVIDAQREKPGYVIWSVDDGMWHGYMSDARNITQRGTGIRPGASEALSRTRQPRGLWETLVGGRAYSKQLDAWSSVYGPNGTGMEVLDIPDEMHVTLHPDFEGIDHYNPRAVADRMMRAMRAEGITFAGTSNFAPGEFAYQPAKPVAATQAQIDKWRELGAAGGTWRKDRIGGTRFHMPAPSASHEVTTPG